jgi:biofilm PGA synthesis lipoprotein PgaB
MRLPRARLLAALLAALVFTAGAAGAAPPARPLRIAQVLLFRGESLAAVEENLARLKEAGVDTIFVRVFQNRWDRPLIYDGRPAKSTGVWFRTGAAPVVEDRLSGIAAACRRQGLAVFAWMTTRSCDWLLSARPDLAELKFDPGTGKVVRSSSLNIFHPAVRRHLAALYRDLARHDIDGILFQDDLVLKAGEGFSPEAIEAYLEAGGPAVSPALLFAPPPGSGAAAIFSPGAYREAFWPWAAWKNRELLRLADSLMAEARAVRPGLRFALNLYYETVLNPRMALAWYAQSIQTAGAHPFDYYSLMSYHRQIARELSYTPAEALEAIAVMSRQAAAAAGDPAKVIVKIQALDWDTHRLIPGAELDRALAAPAPGVSLAFVRSLDDPPLEIVRKHFRPGP